MCRPEFHVVTRPGADPCGGQVGAGTRAASGACRRTRPGAASIPWCLQGSHGCISPFSALSRHPLAVGGWPIPLLPLASALGRKALLTGYTPGRCASTSFRAVGSFSSSLAWPPRVEPSMASPWPAPVPGRPQIDDLLSNGLLTLPSTRPAGSFSRCCDVPQ